MSGSAVQVLQQAEALKTSVSDAVTGSNEAWMKRQSLQDLYQQLLVMDLEYALDKKVEQDLWNHAFKNQINNLQNQAKDKSNPKRGEIQASLDLFLETASGFYIQLLQELCTAFKLDLPFRRKCSNYGIFKERSSNFKIKAPKKTSCMYICQHCLVHLGDIARYRQQIEQAQTYYRHAARLVPYNGQPYNQLAILEAAKGNKLSTVFYYIRSIAVRHPFPVASTNLEKFYVKISKETLDYKGKLSVGEIVSSFLQFHAFIHLSSEPDRAHRHIDRLMASLPSHFTSLSFSAYQLVQMVTINLFAMHHAHRKLEGEGASNKGGEVPEPLSKDEQKCYEQVFNLTVSLLDALLHYTPKQESKAKDYHTLPALKIILDWLHTEDDILEKPVFKNSSIWANLCKLLSNLQSHLNSQDEDIDLEKYTSLPLPEDHDLQCFLSLQKFYSSLDFLKQPIDNMPPELEIRLRCHRLVQHGVWLADKFPSLNLVNYQKLNSGKLQFTIPTAQLRVLTGSEINHPPDRKSTRQNVAIQAIMQKSKKNMQSLSTAPEKKKYTIQQKIATNSESDKNQERKIDGLNKTKTEDKPSAKVPSDKLASNEKEFPPLPKPLSNDQQEFPPLPKPQQPLVIGGLSVPQQQETPSDYQQPSRVPTSLLPAGGVMPHSGATDKNASMPPTLAGHVGGPPLPRPGQFPFQPPPPGSGLPTAQGTASSPNAGGQILTTGQTDDPNFNVPPPLLPGHLRPQMPSQFSGQNIGAGSMNPVYNATMANLQMPPKLAQMLGAQNQIMVPSQPMPRLPTGQLATSPGSCHEGMLQQQGGKMDVSGSPYLGGQQMDTRPGFHHTESGSLGSSPVSPYSGRPILGHQRSSPAQEHPEEKAGQFQPPGQQGPSLKMGFSSLNMGHTAVPGIGLVPNELLQQLQGQSQITQLLQQIGREPIPHPDSYPFEDPAIIQTQKVSPMRPDQSVPIGKLPNVPSQQPSNLQNPLGFGLSFGSPLTGQQPTYTGIDQSGSPGKLAPQEVFGNMQNTPHTRLESHFSELTNRPQNQLDPRSNVDISLYPTSKIPGSSLSQFGQNILKQDSQPPSISSSSFFSNFSLDGEEQPGNQPVTSTYSLFSQSPWAVQITKADNNKSLSSSPFASQSNSLRASPDPFHHGHRGPSPPGSDGNASIGAGMGYRYSQQDVRWGQPPGSNEDTKKPANSVMSHNMQSLWSSGPSPLERLLEQQKHQRQADPH